MRGRNTPWGRVLVLACVWMVLAPPTAAQEERAPDAPPLAELRSKLDRALKAGNLEGAMYRYRVLHQATGQEDAALLGEIGQQVLLRDLRAGRGWLAVNAARVLAVGGDAEALELLLRFAGGTEQQVNLRLGALKALAEVGDESAAPVARQVADDEERRMMERVTALDVLLALGDFSAVQSLGLVLRSADEKQYRIQALEILRDRSAPATDLLRWAARAEDPEIQLLALEGLLKRRDREAAKTLSDMLGDGEVVIPAIWGSVQPEEGKTAPRHSYRQLNRDLRIARALLPQGHSEAMKFIAAAAVHPDFPYNQGRVAGQLALVSPVRGEQLLRELMVVGSFSERLAAAEALAERGHVAEALPVLMEIYRTGEGTPRETARVRAIIALAEIGTVEARGLVRQAAQMDPADLVRQRAGRELALRGDPLGLQVLREMLETADRLLGHSTAVALVEVARQGGDATSPRLPEAVRIPS